MIAKFRFQDFPESVLQTLGSVPLTGTIVRRQVNRKLKPRSLWLSLPFHPLLSSAPLVVKELDEYKLLSGLWPNFRVQIAWSNELRSILKLVQGTSGECLGLVGGNNKK